MSSHIVHFAWPEKLNRADLKDIKEDTSRSLGLRGLNPQVRSAARDMEIVGVCRNARYGGQHSQKLQRRILDISAIALDVGKQLQVGEVGDFGTGAITSTFRAKVAPIQTKFEVMEPVPET